MSEMAAVTSEVAAVTSEVVAETTEVAVVTSEVAAAVTSEEAVVMSEVAEAVSSKVIGRMGLERQGKGRRTMTRWKQRKQRRRRKNRRNNGTGESEQMLREVPREGWKKSSRKTAEDSSSFLRCDDMVVRNAEFLLSAPIPALCDRMG